MKCGGKRVKTRGHLSRNEGTGSILEARTQGGARRDEDEAYEIREMAETHPRYFEITNWAEEELDGRIQPSMAILMDKSLFFTRRSIGRDNQQTANIPATWGPLRTNVNLLARGTRTTSSGLSVGEREPKPGFGGSRSPPPRTSSPANFIISISSSRRRVESQKETQEDERFF